MASVHAAANSLIFSDSNLTEQLHTENSPSRKVRDTNDAMKVLLWFEAHNPFGDRQDNLHSLCSGLSAGDDDRINCDSALAVGTSILLKMDDKNYLETVMKKSDQVKTLADLTYTASSGSKNLLIDSSVLFSRLVIIMSRLSEIESYFTLI
jgi:hypothetical protein